MKKRACILFPYPLGDGFLSGGVSKLVIANIEAVRAEYDVSLLAPRDNADLLSFMRDQYPEVDTRLVDFLPLARFVDNKNPALRALGLAKRIIEFLTTKKNVEKAIREMDPHVLHLHGEVTFPYLKYGRKIGAGTIFHASCFRFSKPEFLRKMVANSALKNASLILSPTQAISALFGSDPKIAVLPNPIITVDGRKEKSGPPPEKELTDYPCLRLLFVGRICVVKQIHYMLKALAGLTDAEKRRVKFFIIGKPNFEPDFAYLEELKAYIREQRLEEFVSFLGYKNNVDEYMRAADVGVLISESEAISMSGIEYLHNGLPIIGFNNPGIDETVVNGVDGILVKNGDVEGLQNAIRAFFDPDVLARMKAAAREECQRSFSMEAFRDRLLQYYHQIERK